MKSELGDMAVLEQIAKSSPAAIVAHDIEGRYTFANRTFGQIVDLPADAVIGKTPADLFPAATAERIHLENRQVIATGESVGGTQITIIDERMVAHRYVRFALYDANGAVSGTAVIGTDVTDDEETKRLIRVQRDLGIALSEARTLSEGLDICIHAAREAATCEAAGIYLADTEAQTLTLAAHAGLSDAFSREAHRYGADTPQYAIVREGKTLYMDFMDERIAVTDVRRREGLRAMGVVPITARGTPIACLNVASRSLSELPPDSRMALEAVAAQVGNAIERLRLVEELACSEERYRLMFAGAIDAVVLHELNPDNSPGPLIDANEAAGRLWGVSIPALRDLDMLELPAPECRDDVNQQLTRLIADREVSFESIIVRSDGMRRNVEVHAHLLVLHGKMISIAVVQDITKRKKNEAAVQRSKRQLQALTARLADISEHERLRVAAELHDGVTQTITGLRFSLEALLKVLPDSVPQAHATRIADAVHDLGAMSGQIRDVIEELRPPTLAHFGLAAALRSHVERVGARFGVTITVEGDEPGPVIPDDVALGLFRIAQEAVSNACKHANANDIRITIDETDTGEIRQVVEDDGSGFENNGGDEIDSPHHLGLATMQERAAALRGRTIISSVPGRGTRVETSIPQPGEAGWHVQ